MYVIYRLREPEFLFDVSPLFCIDVVLDFRSSAPTVCAMYRCLAGWVPIYPVCILWVRVLGRFFIDWSISLLVGSSSNVYNGASGILDMGGMFPGVFLPVSMLVKSSAVEGIFPGCGASGCVGGFLVGVQFFFICIG